jgi:type I restriction enzyme S subunit
MTKLLFDNFELFLNAPNGIEKLRELILQLAVQGKLVPQNPDDEPASELLKKIKAEKERLVKEVKIRKQKPLPRIREDEIPFKIPENWKWCRLGEISSFNFGKTPSTKNPLYWTNDEGVHWISIADMPQRGIIDHTKKNVSKIAVKEVFKNKPIEEGTLLMSFKLSIGKTAISDIQAFHNEAIISFEYILPNLKNYLFWMLSIFSQLGEHKSAIKGNTLNSKSLNEMNISLPPLEEQKRIVEKVDSLMAFCDELEKLKSERDKKRLALNKSSLNALLNSENEEIFQNNWNHIVQNFDLLFSTPENVKELKQAILQLAVQGKLVPQNPDDEPASELLKQIKIEKDRLIKEGKIKKQKPLLKITRDEIPFELPMGWSWCRLGNVCTKITDGFHNTPKKLVNGKPYISATHVKQGKIDWDNCLFVSDKDYEALKNKVNPQKNDILVVNRGAGCGTPAIIDVDYSFTFQNVALLGFIDNLIYNRYLFYFLVSIQREIFAKFVNGGAQPMLSNQKLSNLPINLPPFAEQRLIVEKVDSLMALFDELEGNFSKGINKSEKLVNALVNGI